MSPISLGKGEGFEKGNSKDRILEDFRRKGIKEGNTVFNKENPNEKKKINKIYAIGNFTRVLFEDGSEDDASAWEYKKTTG